VIRLSGNIELTQVDLSFKVPGRLVSLDIKDGSRVAKGAVVARLDAGAVLRQKDREEAGLQAALAQLAQMRTAIEFQRASIDSGLALRKADLDQADARLKELAAGARPQEIQAARAQVEDATAIHEQARRDWERAQTLFGNHDISRAQHDQARTRLDSTGAGLKAARERLQLVTEGTRKEQLDQARAAVDRSRAAVKLTEAERIDLKRREQEIAVREADIKRARAGIAIIETQIEDTVLTAPIDGVVLVKSAEAGEVLAAGAVVATVGAVEDPWVRAYIGERDLGRVKLGSKARLTTDSFPGKVYPGVVTFISQEAEFTPKQIQTQDERVKLVYRIKIEAKNPDQELKANMPVDVEIVP